MAFFCDLTNRLRNSAIFLPLLYFIIGASIYYSWSLSSQNTEVLMKLSMVNAALTATNGDLLKTNTKLKMCNSKESAFTKSNRDLHLSLSRSEDQNVQLNENLALEMKSKQQFLSNFEVCYIDIYRFSKYFCDILAEVYAFWKMHIKKILLPGFIFI